MGLTESSAEKGAGLHMVYNTLSNIQSTLATTWQKPRTALAIVFQPSRTSLQPPSSLLIIYHGSNLMAHGDLVALPLVLYTFVWFNMLQGHDRCPLDYNTHTVATHHRDWIALTSALLYHVYVWMQAGLSISHGYSMADQSSYAWSSVHPSILLSITSSWDWLTEISRLITDSSCLSILSSTSFSLTVDLHRLTQTQCKPKLRKRYVSRYVKNLFQFS